MTGRAGPPLVLEAGDARLVVSPTDGGRIASLVVEGDELLVTDDPDPIQWGCFPMAPFAGRIRDGHFAFRGREVQLPRNLPPDAIHGTVFTRAWSVAGPDRLTVDLGPDWPIRGRVEQTFRLDPDGLEVELRLDADAPMPAALGWHPWFRRRLSGTAHRPRPRSAEVVVDVRAGRMYERGADGLPTGHLVRPGPRPWDDCVIDLEAPPRVSWARRRSIVVEATSTYWVIYDASPDGVCVEPQTAPPDAFNLATAAGDEPPVAEPGLPISATMRWRWSPEPRPEA